MKMLTNEDRQYILKEFLRNISHIADKEYQKRVWILGKGPECDDFDETCCRFFDIGDPMLHNYQEYKISDIQYAVLMNFHREFQLFADEHYGPEEFIDTPEWARIMEMAKEVLQAFNYQKTESAG